MNILMAYLHHCAAFLIFAILMVELVLLKEPLSIERVRRLKIFDSLYGVCAVLILILGVLRVMYFEKGSSYYLHSLPFMIKMTLFGVIGLASIYPTITFLSLGKAIKLGKHPELCPKQLRLIKIMIHIELLGFMGLLGCAAMMAKGFGQLHS